MGKNKKMVFVGIVLAILLLAGYGFFFKKQSSRLVAPITATSTPAISPLNVQGEGDFTVERVPLEEEIKAPDLSRPIVFSDGVPAEFRRIMTERIEKDSIELRKTPDNFDAWLDLAIQRKTIDDYKGAAEIWEYVLEFQPNNSVVLGNLGELHHLYLKDYPKSESYYKAAISLDPSRVDLYRALHELYKYSYKQNTSAAADILKEGLVKNPDNTDLLILLGAYYRDNGDKQSARVYFEQALSIAKKNQNQVLVDALERDISKL
ncbi:MAG: hypothetical protein A3D56_01260 [Candidatus Taylorbacteria bacterium RIFCSPHIGHO2_02_FULL_45_35]|uniref:Uncharacterized protein n=1 Tax=Candidatus Taylorbacteria bacterium RIFCSPHIGHO2_02_FULL_45_35 TaxID=1802311 RepID=A0A1G2MNF1_9BACT|nr:MAG: hypothetical protein A3D56_01260 [Candidatus Taylorbacteria bacterium RIFCSPHIGHO2_02_FULL_45_35]